MGCSSCSSGGCGTPNGCGDKGHCSSGGCNKLNTFDWLSNMEQPEAATLDIIEVSFKNGIRKAFYRKPSYVYIVTGDMVAVEGSSGGYDIGRVSLMGELVRLQMKKKRVKPSASLPNVLRMANERDLERLDEARDTEREAMIRARAIARQLGLDMKIGEVEFQGDKRKATFYYTADGRVDFRELIRVFAREFKVKIEMRQIGARQESALIGGLGPCGRELCCSTWLTDFKSVSTTAARYQNLAINQSKLSGQCGRLKCCLNFELNTYLDALREFPRNVDRLKTKQGDAFLLKTDIFKRIMYFAYRKDFGGMDVHPLPLERVHEILEMNKKGKKPYHLRSEITDNKKTFNFKENKDDDFVDGAGTLELSQLETKKKRRKKRRKKKPTQNVNNQGENQNSGKEDNNKESNKGGNNSNQKKSEEKGENQNRKKRRNNRRRNKPRNKGPKPNNDQNDKK
jgi:cell fate regulator YaaT (PSP1 superfamily)